MVTGQHRRRYQVAASPLPNGHRGQSRAAGETTNARSHDYMQPSSPADARRSLSCGCPRFVVNEASVAVSEYVLDRLMFGLELELVVSYNKRKI